MSRDPTPCCRGADKDGGAQAASRAHISGSHRLSLLALISVSSAFLLCSLSPRPAHTCSHLPPLPPLQGITSHFSCPAEIDQYLAGPRGNSCGGLILLRSGAHSWSNSCDREQSHLLWQPPRAPRFKPRLHHLQPSITQSKLTEFLFHL